MQWCPDQGERIHVNSAGLGCVDLETGDLHGSGGSNPSASAILTWANDEWTATRNYGRSAGGLIQGLIDASDASVTSAD